MKKILLASSSKSFLQRNKNLLTRENFQLFTANSGAEALQLHKGHLFDLILADLHLNDMGGDELCSLLRSEKADVAVILFCYDKLDEHERVARCGADAKIIRPIQPEQMIETIGSLLDMQLTRTKRAIFKVRVLSKKGTMEFYCVSLDISITGILLETGNHLDIGDRIICQFTLPGSSRIEAEADVVRSIKTPDLFKYGVQFVGLPLSSRREIECYVASVRR
jgi:DNA-binding response OmpR family regulator